MTRFSRARGAGAAALLLMVLGLPLAALVRRTLPHSAPATLHWARGTQTALASCLHAAHVFDGWSVVILTAVMVLATFAWTYLRCRSNQWATPLLFAGFSVAGFSVLGGAAWLSLHGQPHPVSFGNLLLAAGLALAGSGMMRAFDLKGRSDKT